MLKGVVFVVLSGLSTPVIMSIFLNFWLPDASISAIQEVDESTPRYLVVVVYRYL